MTYRVVLLNLKDERERITLEKGIVSKDGAELMRKKWRRVLGGRNWTVDRRPGLDTLDYVVLKVEEV